MKRFSMVLAIMLVLVMTLPMVVYAGPDGIIENPEITVPYTTPTIDGNIDPAEGWSVAALMNAETLGYYWQHNPLTSDGNIFYAVDADGISVGGKVVEGLSAISQTGEDVGSYNQFNYSTGPDDIDFDATKNTGYGWNGDVMGLMFDPCEAFINEGLVFNEEVSAWYLVGLFEGDVAKVYREKVNQGDITDKVQAAGKKTADGWMFEVKFPWDMIIDDANAVLKSAGSAVVLTKADVLKTGVNWNAGAMYHDRFYDEEQGGVMTWGRFITAPTNLPDGTPGNKGPGENIASYGINLKLSEVPGSTEGTTTNNNTANNTTTNNNNKTPNKGSNTGTNAAQTLDMSVVIALGALATSGIGIVACKKRK